MKPAIPAFVELERVVASMDGDALAGARRAALERFKTRGFPTTRDEDWKYTDLSSVIDISNRWLASDAKSNPPIDAKIITDIKSTLDASWLVIANGELQKDLSTAFDVDGVSISESIVGDSETASSSALADLNLALLTRGISVTVPKNQQLQRPVALLIVDNAVDDATASQVRIDIALEPGSKARFVEYHVSNGGAEHYSNVHINLDVDRDASVDYLRFQQRALTHSQTARINIALNENASLHHSGIDLGGKLIRNDLQVDINGRNVSATFDGLYIAAGTQHIDNHTRVDHRIGPAESRQEYRGVISGRSRAVWNGKAIVHRGADGSDAKQANHNLLLSDHAEIDAKPELEIYADEVKCAHGTTVGQLDESALFYLRSRGIDRVRAERILTRAFAARIVNQSPLPEMHDWIGGKVEQRLREIAGTDSK